MGGLTDGRTDGWMDRWMGGLTDSLSVCTEQIKLLTGHTADTNFLSKLTWIAMTHDPQVTHIETLRAYHYGNNYLVKVGGGVGHLHLNYSMVYW